MNTTGVVALVTAGALALGGSGALVANELVNTQAASEPPKSCEDWGVSLPDEQCFGAGIIRNVSLQNLQGAAQFCNWKKANPGEWLGLKSMAETRQQPSKMITWMGNHILNDLQAYFVLGGTPFVLKPPTAPNVCKTPLATSVKVLGVTPGTTSVTVTVTTNG